MKDAAAVLSDLSWNDVVVVDEDSVSNRLGDEVVILSLSSGAFYGLNETGARIWELLQQPITISEIHSALLEDFNIDADTARQDLFHLLKQLRARGLVRVRSERSAQGRRPPK